MRFSLVIPVYRNEAGLPDLVAALVDLHTRMDGDFEAVLVVDGSPDRSLETLRRLLPATGIPYQLVSLTRNFGSFAAIRAGLACARGEFLAVMAADLQEPPELVLEFRRRLEAGAGDVVVGVREGREDPWASRVLANVFWGLYRRWVQREVPPGGVDVFACTRRVRDRLLALPERNSTLVGLLYWLGFRRVSVPYTRRPRAHGKSAWTFRRKWRYLKDSLFAFSDLPMRLLGLAGVLGMALSVGLSLVVLVAKWTGAVAVPGYAATVLTVMFFGGLNSFGLGLLGEYLWRVFENTKGRPAYVVDEVDGSDGTPPPSREEPA